MWQQLGYLLVAALLIFLLVRMVRGQKQLFSKENLIKSMGTVGWLALLMIGVIALCVFLLK